MGTRIGIEKSAVISVTKESIIAVFASGSQSNTQTRIARNCTINKTAQGRYTITFTGPHPDGNNYEVLFGAIENGNVRDVPKVSVVRGSRTVNGFDAQVTTDDNGGTADVYSNDFFSFAVVYELEVVTGVT